MCLGRWGGAKSVTSLILLFTWPCSEAPSWCWSSPAERAVQVQYKQFLQYILGTDLRTGYSMCCSNSTSISSRISWGFRLPSVTEKDPRESLAMCFWLLGTNAIYRMLREMDVVSEFHTNEKCKVLWGGDCQMGTGALMYMVHRAYRWVVLLSPGTHPNWTEGLRNGEGIPAC